MNKRGEDKIPFLHEVIRKQDVQTCCINLKMSTYTDLKTGWEHYRGFHAGRKFRWKTLLLSMLIIFGLHENLFCFISWIQEALCLYTPKKPEAWLCHLFLIAKFIYLSVLRIQNREMQHTLEILNDSESALRLLGRWKGLNCLQQVPVSPLDTMAPNKPSAMLLVSCTVIWAGWHVFWKLMPFPHTTQFLRWQLLSELSASWQCLKICF
jgi:hypothetical protein